MRVWTKISAARVGTNEAITAARLAPFKRCRIRDGRPRSVFSAGTVSDPAVHTTVYRLGMKRALSAIGMCHDVYRHLIRTGRRVSPVDTQLEETQDGCVLTVRYSWDMRDWPNWSWKKANTQEGSDR